jgi:hypothetical protein
LRKASQFCYVEPIFGLEAVAKPQIAFDGKARADEKAQHTREYVSILKRFSTQPSGVRWGFEMASKLLVLWWPLGFWHENGDSMEPGMSVQ